MLIAVSLDSAPKNIGNIVMIKEIYLLIFWPTEIEGYGFVGKKDNFIMCFKLDSSQYKVQDSNLIPVNLKFCMLTIKTFGNFYTCTHLKMRVVAWKSGKGDMADFSQRPQIKLDKVNMPFGTQRISNKYSRNMSLCLDDQRQL